MRDPGVTWTVHTRRFWSRRQTVKALAVCPRMRGGSPGQVLLVFGLCCPWRDVERSCCSKERTRTTDTALTGFLWSSQNLGGSPLVLHK